MDKINMEGYILVYYPLHLLNSVQPGVEPVSCDSRHLLDAAQYM